MVCDPMTAVFNGPFFTDSFLHRCERASKSSSGGRHGVKRQLEIDTGIVRRIRDSMALIPVAKESMGLFGFGICSGDYVCASSNPSGTPANIKNS